MRISHIIQRAELNVNYLCHLIVLMTSFVQMLCVYPHDNKINCKISHQIKILP